MREPSTVEHSQPAAPASAPAAGLAEGGGLGHLVLVVLAVIGVTALFYGVALLLGAISGIGTDGVLTDLYAVTGSRWTSLASNAEMLVWGGAAAVAWFAAWLVHGRHARFLWWTGALSLVLLLDDYLAIHESADDVLELVGVIQGEPSHLVKNVLEAAVFGCYALLFLAWAIRYRDLIRAAEPAILGAAAGFLGLSLLLDMVPFDSLAASIHLPVSVLPLVEDGCKMVGIALFATWVARTARRLVIGRDRAWSRDEAGAVRGATR